MGGMGWWFRGVGEWPHQDPSHSGLWIDLQSWTCRVETDEEKVARDYSDKGHTKDDMDTGVCVIENRVCVGGIRAIRRRKCF